MFGGMNEHSESSSLSNAWGLEHLDSYRLTGVSQLDIEVERMQPLGTLPYTGK